MCHTPNKYKHGELVYLPRLQAIAAIGHECADPRTRAAANREFREREARDWEEDYLLDHLPLVSLKLAVANEFRGTATADLLLYRAIRRKAPTIHYELRQAKNRGGQLTAMEKVGGDIAAIGPDGFGRSRGLQAREISFGKLEGSILAMANYNPVAELSRVIDRLRPCARWDDENVALDAVAVMDDQARRRTYGDLRAADTEFPKCIARMQEFAAFFAADNIERISAWAAHPGHPHPFQIKIIRKDDGTMLLLKSAEEHCLVRIPAELHPPRLRWPSLR
jgi:hypothetical protein